MIFFSSSGRCRKAVSSIAFLLITYTLISQVINPEPLSPRITGYTLDVKLDTASKTVSGRMEAFWVNNTGESVPDVQLHMYMNAFKSGNSTFYKESGRYPSTKVSSRGWINISSLTDRSGNDLTSSMSYISPDDGNNSDSTVLRVMLPSPALPGDTVFIRSEFETKLPSNIRRAGYTGEFFFVAQWFPKFGVYEPAGMRYRTEGGWNCHQFHANSEFYSDHSVYDVKITLPKRYVAGSGGVTLGESDAGGNLKTLSVRAEDIVDFAWTAWPGYKVFTDKWEHVDITLLLPEIRKNQAERQLRAVKNALEYLTVNVGPYPWPHLTFVDPPTIGAGAGGMEYTTLFTSASADRMPEWYHLPEVVTVHEFGHAYFMGIMASNEFEEPWMDEGINSFMEARIVDHYWGEKSGYIDHPRLKVSDLTYSRIPYVRSTKNQLVSNVEYSWNYPYGTYEMMSYSKPAIWLYTLMGIIGEDTMNEVLREYYRQWAFRHPSGRDFINVVNEVVRRIHADKFGPDMNWFFEQTLYGTGICDYKAAGFENIRLRKEVKTASADNEADKVSKDSLYKAVVKLQRLGDVMLPVDVLVHFENGDEVLRSWDGKSRFMEIEIFGHGRMDWYKIDPEYKIKMDVNFINNSMTSDPYLVPVRRLTNKFIIFIQFCLSIITF